jgi:uncharacterized protein YutE (UPF0331/DUF86 family)
VVDAPRLRALLQRLETRCDRLRGYAALSAQEYLGAAERVDASKYLLVTAIEDALSAANHVIAAEGYRPPGDYADAFRSLAEAGVVDVALSERLQAMARFRNLLVHGYAEVDDLRVHEFLRKDLDDLRGFLAAMVRAFPVEGSPGADD